MCTHVYAFVNGSDTMKKREDGRYVKSKNINGKRVFFYSSEPTERKALKDIERQMLEYAEREEKGKTFKEVAEEWESEYREKSSDIQWRKSIGAQYRRIVDYFDDTLIKSITPHDVDVFIRRLNYGYKTVASHKCVLNMICNFAILHSYIDINPVSAIVVPRGLARQKRDIPDTETLKIITDHHDGFDLLPFFLLYTGCRKSEALAITNNDIDLKHNKIKIRHHVIHDGNKPLYEPIVKTSASYRDVILLEKVKNVLPKDFKGFLFSMNGDGIAPLTKKAFDVRLKRYCQKYNVSLTAHQLRHGYATMLYEAKVGEKDAQKLMGHEDIALTHAVYTHIREVRDVITEKQLNSFSF